MLLNCGAGEYSWESLRLQGDQAWIFIGRTDAGAEASKFGVPEAKSWLIGKDTDVGKDWGQEKEVTEDETVGWHHWRNGDEFEQTRGDKEGQGNLTCHSLTGHRELVVQDLVTEQQQQITRDTTIDSLLNVRLILNNFMLHTFSFSEFREELRKKWSKTV